MRKTLAAALGVAALGASVTTATAAQAAPGNPETFVARFLTTGGVDRPTHIVAVGPIHGIGTSTQVEQENPDGETVDFTWHLRRGTVTAHAVERYSIAFDAASCTARGTGNGTWRFTGGTGAYASTRGSGRFTVRGWYLGARDSNGACQGPDAGVPPKIALVTLVGRGAARLR